MAGQSVRVSVRELAVDVRKDTHAFGVRSAGNKNITLGIHGNSQSYLCNFFWVLNYFKMEKL